MASEEQTALSHLPYLFHRWERPVVLVLWISVVILQIYIEDYNHHGFRHRAFQHKHKQPQDATHNAILPNQDPEASPDQNAQSAGENIDVSIYDHVMWRDEATALARSYCQVDFDIAGNWWSGLGQQWFQYYRRPSWAYGDVPCYSFRGNLANKTAKPFEGKPPWIEDLAAEKFVSLESTFYQSTNITQHFIPVANKYVDPDIFATVTELQYTSTTNDGNSHLVEVHCCLSDGTDRSIVEWTDHDVAMTNQIICLGSACPPPYDPSKLLGEVWKATLSGIIAEATNACLHRVGTRIYNASLLHQFYSDGLAKQIAVDLWEFHRSSEEADSDVFLAVDIMTSVPNEFSNIPNHQWSLEEFLTILVDTTSSFHQESLEGGYRVVTDPSLLDMCDREGLGKAIVESLIDKLDSMRSHGWQEKEFDYPLQVYNLATMKNFAWMEREGFCPSVSLLPGSKCGNALDALDIVLPSLLVSQDEWEYDSQQQGLLIMVGTLVAGLLLVQATLRWQRLPGGCLMKRDLKRSIDRNRQVRMALEDEYLCREREFRAVEQLGEDAAREALGLLRTAAYREPGLPHDYQMRQRKYSRWFVMGSHLIVVLMIAIREWGVFLWFEVVLMLINVMQSVAEVRAMRLLLQQDDDRKQAADDVEEAEHDKE